MSTTDQRTESEFYTEQQAWTLLLAARTVVDNKPAHSSTTLNFSTRNASVADKLDESSEPDLCCTASGQWIIGAHVPPEIEQFLRFYLSVLGTPENDACIVGHLGQSVDARIATVNGDAHAVTGQDNIRHLHRLRALCHAVVVGAGTVAADDPQLTTRLVDGSNPTRVVIDPQARLSPANGLFVDNEAPTVWVYSDEVDHHLVEARKKLAPTVQLLPVSLSSAVSDSETIVETLAQIGLTRLFVEGGGITVSRFMQARCLDRLQIASSAVLIGAGQHALQLDGAPTMADALRPAYRLYRMGDDVLWDFDVSERAAQRQCCIEYDRESLPESPAFEQIV